MFNININTKVNTKLATLPEKPGVYIMKDENGVIIYIGKAINLKNRVRQYFQSLAGQTPKVHVMVSQIKDFEYIITNSEVEALILECNLIKKHKPKFNILLKDDKNYPYIKITLNEDYPRILMTRKIEKDGAKYFGPYTSVSDVRQTINFLKKIFSVKSCNKRLPKDIGKGRPCLNYHINQCMAPCQGLITKEEYYIIIKDICDFLSGRRDELIDKLEKEMIDASQNMDYEKAALLRDKISSLNNMFEEQKVVSTSLEDQDVVAIARKDKYASIQIFFIRNGKLIGRKSYIFENIEDDDRELMSSFIKQFYNSSEFIPGEILLQNEIDDKNTIENWLGKKRNARVYIKVPKKGEKLKLIKMVSQNAMIYLENYLKTEGKEKQFYINILRSFAEFMEIDNIPFRIEAYDISNTGVTEITGSMVVFENGLPLPKDYRRFRIKSLDKQDDYAAMQEVVFRRFRKGEEFLTYPDLILVDGGLGHVNAVLEVLTQYRVNIPVFGMVKDEKHRTRGLVSPLREYDLSVNRSVLMLVTSIQDEAHRFALKYNRKLREKRYRESVLDQIPGIGTERKKNLIKYFGSVNRVKEAEINELIEVEGISRKTAENIYNFFRV
jgi:excinuclease ABC subunit C